MDRTITPPWILTTKDLAAELQISEKAATILCSTGQVPALRVGGAWRVRRAALERTCIEIERGERPPLILSLQRDHDDEAAAG